MTVMVSEKEDIAQCMIDSGLLGTIGGDKKTNIDNMRKFHNWVKSELIKQAVSMSNNESLLDLSVGRGGDILKWKNAGIDFVTGIDIDKPSIFSSVERGGEFDGAIARLRQMRIRKPYIRFHQLSVLDPYVLEKLNRLDNNRKYSIVSCQFAFHFFTETNMSLVHTLRLIESKLKPNGIFIATFSDGNKIEKNITVDLPSLQIKKLSTNSYSLMLNAEQQQERGANYFQIIDKNKEFISKIDEIKIQAQQLGLTLIQTKDFYNWYNDYKKDPRFKNLDFQEMLISFLNTSVIFKNTGHI